ncbi:MAG TPA: tripartite tricarboxylate transporter substrate binding protein [Burkholderiales bacterium]|jgi:tripartite-type tricarboxylate transporter receptor subunit TctC|nr:tripartite tricarboxylate transporter substrate binding protein [Burkholderiales bacterium]
MLTARPWIVAYGVACSALSCAAPSVATQWPERPIRIVVPLPAGTSPDLFARHLGRKLAARLKQPVIIENRPGANSVIGTAVVAKASADGYTLLNASVQHVMLKPLLGKLAFDPDADFTPIVTISATEMILVVPATSRFNAVTELVAAAKSKPGELNFATPGIGSPAHLAGQAFLSATGTAARHIPMKGSTESVTAVAGSQVDYTITAVSNALPLIQAGKLRPLAATGPRRHELLTAVPTMREAVPPGFVYETWQAIFAPAGTPRSVVELLNREIARILGEADTREFFEKYGSSPRPRSLDATGEFVSEQSRQAIELVKAIGATAQ